MSAPIDLAPMFAQLEAEEAFEAENRCLIARIQKITMPALLGAAAALTVICLASQALKWIAL